MSLSDEPLDPTVEHELRQRFGNVGPRPELEQQVCAALRDEGLIRPAADRRTRGRRALVAAAAALLFFAGYAAARLTATAPQDSAEAGGSLFLLLLREPTDAPLPAPDGESAVVAEYSAWTRELARTGNLVLGEKLSASRLLVRGGGSAEVARDDTEITGMFLLRAPDLEAARAIARSCPHVRRGGTIEVRPIVPT